ncbi:MAG: hypothetical protein HYV07_08645 [Deltaproteobacteria bacterium]|nr:hypothetical protein [Deltaproteobacteria bacterium]
MRFWDASGVVPLLCNEPDSAAMRVLLRQDREMVVWAWTGPTEVPLE